MKKMMFLLLFVMAAAAGCATLRGMADDMQNLGRGLKKTVAEEGDERRR